MLENTPFNLVPPSPPPPIQMPISRTTPIISHDQFDVIPPVIVLVIVIEDPRLVKQTARMDHLE